MILLLPSYRRLDILPLVLESVLQADTQDIRERILLLVHNNHPPSRGCLDALLASRRLPAPFEFYIIHRQNSVIPIDGWFEALEKTAQEGETIIILGDDDLLLPWGLRNRHREIHRHDADVLLSEFVQRIYFFQQGVRYWGNFQDPIPPSSDQSAEPWWPEPRRHTDTTFVSNHSYRYTPRFRAGLRLAFSWCDQQSWAPRVFSTGLLPSYLPYAVQKSGGKVFFLAEKSVLRGAIFEESIKQDYSDGGTSSFYSLVTLDAIRRFHLFTDKDLKKEAITIYRKSLRSGFFEFLGNPTTDFLTVCKTIKDSGLQIRDFWGWEILKPRPFLRLVPLLRGWSLKRIAKQQGGLQKTRELLTRLNHQYIRGRPRAVNMSSC